jgi:very-short-patch-repair endonuclease
MTSRPSNPARTSPEDEGWAQDSPDSDHCGAHVVKVLGVRAGLVVSGTRDEKIAAIARLQRGRVARRQLLAAGLGYRVISRAVERGLLSALPGGVFAVGHTGAVELGNETALLLALPDGAALSHHTAASIWDMRLSDAGRSVDAVVAHGSYRRVEGCVIHRARNLQPRDIRIRKGLPVTSPARALLDQADELTLRQLELAFDRAIVAQIMRPNDVAELLGRTRGRVGASKLAALLERHTGRTTMTRSHAEEVFLDLIRQAKLPPPQVNARVAGYEVDFLWPERKLIVEVDGFRFHSTRRAFEHDHRKEADLRAAGFTLLRVSFEQLEREPYAVIADLVRALDSAPAAQVATISEPSSREMATSTE